MKRRPDQSVITVACALTACLGLPSVADAGPIRDAGSALESGQARQIQTRTNLENEAQQAAAAQEKDRIAAKAAAEYRAQTTGVSQVPAPKGVDASASGCYPTGARPQAHRRLTGLNAADVPPVPPREKHQIIAANLPATVEGLFTPISPSNIEAQSEGEIDTDWLIAGLTVQRPTDKPPEIDPDTANPAMLAWAASYNVTAMRASVATEALEAVLSRPALEALERDSALSRYTDAEWQVWLSVTTEEGAWRAITELQGHAISLESRRKVLFERLLSVQATRLAVRMGEDIDSLNGTRAAAVGQHTEMR